MKQITILSILLSLFVFQVQAQEESRQSGILLAKEQSIGLGTGIDYAILPLQINYKRGFSLFNYKFPINLGAEITIPMFKLDLNDVRIRLTSETVLFKKNNFNLRGGIDPVFVHTKMKTQNMTSLGADFHIFMGFTNTKWNTGFELNYNQIFSTYIKHSDIYKDNVYQDVLDGWYKNTANNIRIGVFVNRSIKNIGVYFKAGISKTGTFEDYLFVPSIYSNIGVNYRF